MRRITALILSAVLIISLAGCGRNTQPEESSVRFYYLRDTDAYIYGAADGVVTWEERDDSAQSVGTAYLLSLYLMGPLDETLRSPFPSGCKITNIIRDENEITVVVNANFTTLKGMNLTLACVCLARTCMSITGAEVVHIHAETFSGQVTPVETVTLDSLLLEDNVTPTENPS